ncbi:MORN repeat protein, putative [Hepatocystis sp. ex Piliocolobus tephrosceles]|nr:MORN repeat protein, putative [Hepatocystis sp. ex Piliocolobus tephrosceles]
MLTFSEVNVHYKNGDSFFGILLNGQKTNGKYIYANKRIYEGPFKNDKKCGLGRLSYNKKSFYYGMFENGAKKGMGFQKYENGDFYYGEWKHNKKNGNGIYYFFATKEYYYGDWDKGYFTSGVWLLSDELKYVGMFFRNKPKNNGHFVFLDETKINAFYKQLFTISDMDLEGKKKVIKLFWKNI